MAFTPIDIIPDISYYQDKNTTSAGVDFAVMKAKCNGVIIRAGQGGWSDEDFTTNWTNSKTAGLKRGVYWFYDSRYEPIAQAQRFYNLFGNDPPDWGVWIDLEEAYGGAYKGEANWKKFTEQLKFLYKGVIGIYTANWWWTQQIITDYEYWGKFPLWVAQYISDSAKVSIPSGWASFVLWQYTSTGNGREYGAESPYIDLNKTSQEFYDLFGGTTPPPTGDGMTPGKAKERLGNTGTIRENPSRYGKDTGLDVLPYATIDFVEIVDAQIIGTADKAEEKWLKLGEMRFVNYKLYSSGVLKDYFEILSMPSENQPSGDITASITLKADGTVTGTWTKN